MSWRSTTLLLLLWCSIANARKLLLVQSVSQDGKFPQSAVIFSCFDMEIVPRSGHSPPIKAIWHPLGRKLGMQEQFQLGSNISQRYKGFIGSDYHSNQIYVRSTDYNRTLISAYSNLAGMFQGTTDIHKPNSIPQTADWPNHWLPIAVHTVNLATDNLLWMSWPCPAYDSYKTNVIMKSQLWNETVTKYKAFFVQLSSLAGYTVTLDNLWIIEDALYVENIHRSSTRKWPAWVTEEIYNKIEDVNHIADSMLYPDRTTARLRAGPLLDEIVNRMYQKIACQATPNTTHCNWINGLKYYAYSAHDLTVMAFLSTLDAMHIITGLPQYAACVLVELWQEDNGDYSVQIMYKNGFPDPAFNQVQVSGCPANLPCPLDAFKKRSNPFIPTDIFAECGRSNPATTAVPNSSPSPVGSSTAPVSVAGSSNGAVIALGVVSGLLAVICIILIVVYCRLRSQKSEDAHFSQRMRELSPPKKKRGGSSASSAPSGPRSTV